MIPNSGQEDNDGDGEGDVCDADDDGDGILDTAVSSPSIWRNTYMTLFWRTARRFLSLVLLISSSDAMSMRLFWFGSIMRSFRMILFDSLSVWAADAISTSVTTGRNTYVNGTKLENEPNYQDFKNSKNISPYCILIKSLVLVHVWLITWSLSSKTQTNFNYFIAFAG